jgi:antirestriction protein ArdC
MTSPRAYVYSRVTARIVADLAQGVRPWLKPWSANNADGRIVQPLRANGQPYKGINVLMLWGEALAKGFACPFWMTYRQVSELGGQVRKGEHGSLVVYADRIRRTETADNGEEIEHEIPFMKGYTVFNCEQIEGLSEHFYARPSPPLPCPPSNASPAPSVSPQRPAPISATAATGLSTRSSPTMCSCRRSRASPTPKATTARNFMSSRIMPISA